MIAALPSSSGASDDARSYDLVWTIHLVGDIYQPLHAVSRYTHAIPNGDARGNAEMVIPATGETVALHAYWDGIFGGYASPYGVIFDARDRAGLASLVPNPIVIQVLDPEKWTEESAALAQAHVFAAPVSTGRMP